MDGYAKFPVYVCRHCGEAYLDSDRHSRERDKWAAFHGQGKQCHPNLSAPRMSPDETRMALALLANLPDTATRH